ncbi:MAG: hypothetical protein AB8G15_05995 [Saprospiraceae bacterium]
MKKIIYCCSILCYLMCQAQTFFAQKSVSIVGTNLKISLTENYTLNPNSAMISSPTNDIVFMEMAGVNYQGQMKDFEGIEGQYAEKGIQLQQKRNGKINTYDAILMSFETQPDMYQVFFGNEFFCAMATVVAKDTMSTLDESAIYLMLNTIEYEKSTESALDLHANFIIEPHDEPWEFMDYTGNMFFYENKRSEEGLLVMQLPLEPLLLSTEADLGHEFVNKMKAKMPELKIIEDEAWQAKNVKGHRILLDTGKDGKGNLGLLYLFVFQGKNSAFVFQGMGKKNDVATKERFSKFLNHLSQKE